MTREKQSSTQSRGGPHQQPAQEVILISGGFVGGGESNSARRPHVHRVNFNLKVSPVDDPLVFNQTIANYSVKRVLINSGSLGDIIFAPTFNKLNIGREKLILVTAPLIGFWGEKTHPLGAIFILVKAGRAP